MKKTFLIYILFFCHNAFSQENNLSKVWERFIEIPKSTTEKIEINEISGRLITFIPKDTVIQVLDKLEDMRYYVPYVTNISVVKNLSNKASVDSKILKQGLFNQSDILNSKILRSLNLEFSWDENFFLIIEEVFKSVLTQEINEIDLKLAIQKFKERNPKLGDELIFGVIREASLISINHSKIHNNKNFEIQNLNFESTLKIGVLIQLSKECNELLIRKMIKSTKEAHPDKLDHIFSYEDYLNFSLDDKNEIDLRVLSILQKLSFAKDYQGEIN